LRLSQFIRIAKGTGGIKGPFPLKSDPETFYYRMEVSKDRFIHFTTPEAAKAIVQSKKLLLKPPGGKTAPGASGIFAVSLVWGHWAPQVQTTHIPSKHLVAITFMTNVVPDDIAQEEEVKWHKDVPIKNAKIVSYGTGKRLLQKAPFPLPEDHMIWYGKGEPQSYWADKW
jgi:hypothetical protein